MIENYIPVGYENAVTLETLMEMTGLSNRQVRDLIANSDELILNLQDGKGYFRFDPQSKAERAFAEQYVAQEKSRGWSVLRRAFRVQNKLKQIQNRGHVYRFARLLAGYSVDEVAQALKVSHYYVTSVEDGYYEPNEEFKKGFEKLVGLEI